MIDNFSKIESLLKFKNEGDFYFIQILRRRKDNPNMPVDMQVINNYFVYSIDDYQQKKHKILIDCEAWNARAYIRVNVRNTKKIAFQTLRKISEYICNGDFHAVKNAYLSACGEYNSEDVKRWIVDIDGVNCEKLTSNDLSQMNTYINWITECEPVGPKVLDMIPTKNGYHLITTPFNIQTWRKMIPNPIDIHKDNPTILYIP